MAIKTVKNCRNNIGVLKMRYRKCLIIKIMNHYFKKYLDLLMNRILK